MGIPIPTITEAVNARFMSGQVQSPQSSTHPSASRELQKKDLIEDLRKSLYLAKIISYSQGFTLLRHASSIYGWQLNLAEISRIWQAGCIIRAELLQTISTSFKEDMTNREHMMFAPAFTDAFTTDIPKLRAVISTAILSGIPMPGISSALLYYDRLLNHHPYTHIIAAQRDYFGSHGYERDDREGIFHTDWS
jgi:6-phosphogluconate dehydrogenase